MREHFTTINFRSEARAVIEQANAIIEQHQAQGSFLTLRQLYYQFVSRGPNRQRTGRRVQATTGTIVADARRAGLIDWGAIEDPHARYLRDLPTWRSPATTRSLARLELYREDIWATQPYRVEVWIRKRRVGRRPRGCLQRVSRPLFLLPRKQCRTPRCTRRASDSLLGWVKLKMTDQWPRSSSILATTIRQGWT